MVRLRQVVGHSQSVQGTFVLVNHGRAADHDPRKRTDLPKSPTDLDARQNRHVEVKQNQVEWPRVGVAIEGLAPISGLDDVVTLRSEELSN